MTTVAPTTAQAGGATDLELYRRMLLIRLFEEKVQALYMRGEVHGTTHLYIGEEAVAVGICAALDDRDRVAGTYRGHGHALARGVAPQALMDEMLGRATGICGGRAGSMNVIDLGVGLIGCFGIVGGSIGAATGAALALKRANTGGIAVAFFGDGTTNQGYFHECLNFAKVNALPVLYVCENNLYGEFTPLEQSTAGAIADRPAVYGIPVLTIDGNDVWQVRDSARAAVARARAGGGPQFIEALTYRFVGHSRSDSGKYRPPGELDRWKLHDPLVVARERLGDTATVEAEMEAFVDALAAAGIAAPHPSVTAGSEFR